MTLAMLSAYYVHLQRFCNSQLKDCQQKKHVTPQHLVRLGRQLQYCYLSVLVVAVPTALFALRGGVQSHFLEQLSQPKKPAQWFYFHRSGMTGILQGSFLFCFMTIVSMAFFLMLGAAVFQFSLVFVRYIYPRIKSD